MTALTRPAAFANRFAGRPNYTPTASLTIPTPDGSGETTEPTYRPKPSWVTVSCTHLLAHNPLPGGSAANENPCLVVSADNGSTWTTPAGLVNPIAGTPAAGHHADVFLLVDPNADRIILYWNRVADATTPNNNGIYYSICTDPTLAAWSASTQLMSSPNGNDVLEPKVTWDPARGKYVLHCFRESDLTIRYALLDTATSATVTTSLLPTAISVPPAFAPIWHYDIIRESSGRWVMAFCDNSNPRRGGFASSPDGVSWQVAPRPFMLDNAWAVSGVYRPSLQSAATGGGYDLVLARHQNPSALLGVARNIPATEIP